MGFIHWLACCYWIHLVTAQAAMPTTFNHPKPPTTTPKHPQPPGGHVASAITNKCNYGFTRRMRHIYMFFTLPLAVALHFNWVACAAGSPTKKRNISCICICIRIWIGIFETGTNWKCGQVLGGVKKEIDALRVQKTSNTWNILCKLEKWHESGLK